MRVLIVKTTSMGDVVHTLPALSDMIRARSDLIIDWVVEAPFADIVRAHPGVARVIPIAWRKWRRRWWQADVRAAIAHARTQLRAHRYDLIIDFQGLLKSVFWARQAQGPVVGLDAASIREPLASWFYTRAVSVPRDLHAITRSRRLAAAALGYALDDSSPQFGLAPAQATNLVDLPERYAILIPCASRVEKLWPETDWIAIGQHWQRQGLRAVILWGSPEELARAQRIAQGCEGWVPPFLSVGQTASVLHGASQLVGLDTGFSHLGAALGVPSVGIYCDHEPGLAGITGSGRTPVVSLGGKGQRPTLSQVMTALETIDRP